LQPAQGDLAPQGGGQLPPGGVPLDARGCQVGQFAQVLQFGQPIGVVQLTPQGWAGPPELLRHLSAAPATFGQQPPPSGLHQPSSPRERQAVVRSFAGSAHLWPQHSLNKPVSALSRGLPGQVGVRSPSNPHPSPPVGPKAARNGQHSRDVASQPPNGLRPHRHIPMGPGNRGDCPGAGGVEADVPAKRQKLSHGGGQGVEASKVSVRCCIWQILRLQTFCCVFSAHPVPIPGAQELGF
jgi:hypothetical protein